MKSLLVSLVCGLMLSGCAGDVAYGHEDSKKVSALEQRVEELEKSLLLVAKQGADIAQTVQKVATHMEVQHFIVSCMIGYVNVNPGDNIADVVVLCKNEAEKYYK